MLNNKKAQLEEINLVGVIFAIIGGLLSIIITNKMTGGIFLKILGFAITAVVCYFVAGKILDA